MYHRVIGRSLGQQARRQSRGVDLVECPRDAMQGLPEFVPTKDKIRYINKLLEVGYHTVDFGSFVSAPAVPQMRDTVEVLEGLNLENSKSELLAVVCNVRGAQDAASFKNIKYLGFPLSMSEEFQQRNTRRGIESAFEMLEKLQDICVKNDKELVTYISMAFGNPYGEEYSPELVSEFVEKVKALGCTTISLADTVCLFVIWRLQKTKHCHQTGRGRNSRSHQAGVLGCASRTPRHCGWCAPPLQQRVCTREDPGPDRHRLPSH